jgi:hypothetical protein
MSSIETPNPVMPNADVTADLLVRAIHPATNRFGYATITQLLAAAAGATVLSSAEWASLNPVLSAGELGIESNTGIVRIGDGVTAYLSLSAGVRTGYQTATLTNSTLVTADMVGMAASVQDNHRYLFEAWGIYQTAATTTGLGVTATIPAVDDTDAWTLTAQQGGTGTDQMFTQSSATFGSALVSASVIAQDTNYWWKIEGLFTPAADGTVQLKARSEVDTSQITVSSARFRLTDFGV